MTSIAFIETVETRTRVVPEDAPGTYTVRYGLTDRVIGFIEDLPSGYTAKAVGTDHSRTHIGSLREATEAVVEAIINRAAYVATLSESESANA